MSRPNPATKAALGIAAALEHIAEALGPKTEPPATAASSTVVIARGLTVMHLGCWVMIPGAPRDVNVNATARLYPESFKTGGRLVGIEPGEVVPGTRQGGQQVQDSYGTIQLILAGRGPVTVRLTDAVEVAARELR